MATIIEITGASKYDDEITEMVLEYCKKINRDPRSYQRELDVAADRAREENGLLLVALVDGKPVGFSHGAILDYGYPAFSWDVVYVASGYTQRHGYNIREEMEAQITKWRQAKGCYDFRVVITTGRIPSAMSDRTIDHPLHIIKPVAEIYEGRDKERS